MTIQANFPNVQPSLLLDFANAKQLPPSVTFTRATTAAYYDGNTTAKAEQNFFFYSQDFSQAAWGVNGATKTSTTQTDPAGGSTALLLTKVTDDTYSLRQYSGGPNPAGKTFTYSVYLKGASAGSLRLFVDNGVDQSFVSDISITTSWVRYTLTTGAFNNTTAYLTAGVSLQSGSVTSVNVAFAQIEERSSATAYTATTTQAITNYIPVLLTAGGGQPRFDHNPTTSESLGLLIEEQRTNLVNYSRTIAATWNTQGCSVSATAVAPDGTLTGTVIQEDTAAGSRHGVYTSNVGAYSVSATTWSVYAKAGVRDKIVFVAYNSGWSASSSAISITSGTPVGNGWYRITWTTTPTSSAAPAYLEIWPADATGDIYYTGSGWNALSIWGAQAEVGSFATSFIPTSGAAATRAADLATMTGVNFSSWFNNQEGTIYYSGVLNGRRTAGFENVAIFTNGTTTTNSFGVGTEVVGNDLRAFVLAEGTLQADLRDGAPQVGTQFKGAFAYQANDFAFCADNGTVQTDSSGLVPSGIDRVTFGVEPAGGSPYNGTINKVAYYPQRITDAQVKALTS